MKKKPIKKPIDWRVLSVAILCLTIIEIYALSKGINGLLMSGVIAVIAGIAGYKIRK